MVRAVFEVSAGEMPSDGTLGYLVGKLDVLRIECWRCDRHERCHVAGLVAELGADHRLTDWLHERTVNCPYKDEQGVTPACGAHMPDLCRLP